MLSAREICFDIIAGFRNSKCVADISNILKRSGGVFGYDAFVAGYLPRSQHQTLQDCVMVSGWPTEWERRYQAKGYIHIDPVLRHMRDVIDPFLWQEVAEAPEMASGQIVFDEARAFRLSKGFCVPLHHYDGGEACISFGGERLELSPDERAALHLVAIYALSAARKIVHCHAGHIANEEPKGPLTAREIECLKWSAAGKTAWDISVILSISRRTVEHHLESASNKLQAVSRVQCVAEAIRRGIIT
ncbi:helix-turn-helix transcriptional regulator [Methylobacterium brachiatum]|uniref:helix-turn-helix transcriptional regulator n=1 Tax=Methylobacterium brachiatum TaxID=269660 RepID=UPI0008F37767|nr:LuxR family transcriptional regulator [Methylobacterium brachiatum]SFI20043.1 LuxR family transcriptional regulator, quorum sensing-dependent transcriptional regulator [Methylobacterium brachiatum]